MIKCNINKRFNIFDINEYLFKFKDQTVHLKKNMHEFICELLDFPKGSHDDTIDAFWLATQFAKGNKKAGTIKKIKDKDGWSKPRKRYNWITGART